LHRANAGGVRSHPISSPKPNSQGKVGIVHQSSSQGRSLMVTVPTFKPLLLGQPPPTQSSAFRADKPLRPSILNEILPANLIVMKPGRKLQKSCRVGWLSHSPGYQTWRTLVKVISVLHDIRRVSRIRFRKAFTRPCGLLSGAPSLAQNF
jgi:hypothetical protein